MKLIKINESQEKRLFEAYKEGFSFDELTTIADSAFADEDNSVPQMAYCRKWLGEPTFMGSSRCVFTLSDNIVLKLAYGKKYQAGIAQNEMEYLVHNQFKSPLWAKIYDHDKNFTYLVCENVIPAEPVDFEKILGMPFYERYMQNSEKHKDGNSKYNGDYTVGYNKYFDNIRGNNEEVQGVYVYQIMCYLEANYVLDENCFSLAIEDAIYNSEWLRNLRDLIRETKIADLCQPSNFGVVNRDGKPMLVIIDGGMNMSVWNKFYRYG
jgi:hypothetical protein